MSTRQLWETLVELAEATAPTGRSAGMVRVDTLGISMPLELTMPVRDGVAEVRGAAPAWRWTTPFDLPTSRLSITLGIMGAEGLAS